MRGPMVKLTVEVFTDAVPGWGDNAEDFRALTQRLLDGSVGHYSPRVEILQDVPEDAPTLNERVEAIVKDVLA